MPDFSSSLPIRTELDGTDSRVHIKGVDFADPGGTDKQVQVSEKLWHIRAFGNDSDGAKIQLRLSQLGAPNSDGVYHASDNKKPAHAGVIGHVRAASPADSDLTNRITSITSGSTHALDVSIHDESGNPFSASNPLPVTSVDSEGDEVNDYNTAASVAAAGTSNHDYTVTALKTLKLSQIWATSSGKLKIEVQIETAVASGVFNTRFVGFNSTANPNILVPVGENISVAAGVRVRVIRTNKDNQSADLYSTITGHEI